MSPPQAHNHRGQCTSWNAHHPSLQQPPFRIPNEAGKLELGRGRLLCGTFLPTSQLIRKGICLNPFSDQLASGGPAARSQPAAHLTSSKPPTFEGCWQALWIAAYLSAGQHGQWEGKQHWTITADCFGREGCWQFICAWSPLKPGSLGGGEKSKQPSAPASWLLASNPLVPGGATLLSRGGHTPLHPVIIPPGRNCWLQGCPTFCIKEGGFQWQGIHSDTFSLLSVHLAPTLFSFRYPAKILLFSQTLDMNTYFLCSYSLLF